MLPEFERVEMVERQIVARGIRDPRVIDAMLGVSREYFVPQEAHGLANDDQPLSIGHGQTISQPYIVALMTELLELPDEATVLEVGAGSGYQTAVLAHIVAEVCAIERIPKLASLAKERLEALGFSHIDLRCGDGFIGWPEPGRQFDGVLVACAAEEVPRPLIEQLRPGGRLVAPIGPAGAVQDLMVLKKDDEGQVLRSRHSEVRFVPMLPDVGL